ncbi:transglycosylase [Sinomonas sp. JGH33]|uniref:Transglycosylase n=1 Tax=Sinomonas terricola TaxID=3110330 RepID=A0ABU5T4G0_9MICC|nr:transglycosylase [Sinomonas sp. JGH33]MEA5454545.1 transglycosylase [Sinomonas sp. JGH33]
MRRVWPLRLHRPALAAMLSTLLVLGSCVTTAMADDGPPTGFPSWDDVQAAKVNVDAAQAEVTKITGLLAGVQAAAADASAKAVAAGAAYAKAAQAVKDQQKVVDALHAVAAQRVKERDSTQQTAGRVAAAAYTGGSASGMLDAFSVLGQSDGLDRLGTLQILGDQAAKAVAQYKAAANNANAAEAQSREAEDALAKLSDAAKQDFDAAAAAQKHAQDVVAQTQQQQDTLTAQLADLKNTSVSVEQQYEAGQAALAAYQAAQAEKQRQAQLQKERAAAAAQIIPAATVVSPGVGSVVNDPAGAKAYAGSQIGGYGWGGSEFQCLLQLWTRESSWMTDATNPSSGAYGIAQALPADKYYSAGNDWLTNYRTQINWGLGYIRDRYGSPCNAWAHEVAIGWY